MVTMNTLTVLLLVLCCVCMCVCDISSTVHIIANQTTQNPGDCNLSLCSTVACTRVFYSEQDSMCFFLHCDNDTSCERFMAELGKKGLSQTKGENPLQPSLSSTKSSHSPLLTAPTAAPSASADLLPPPAPDPGHNGNQYSSSSNSTDFNFNFSHTSRSSLGGNLNTSTEGGVPGQVLNTSTEDGHAGKALNTSTEDGHVGKALNTSTEDGHAEKVLNTSTEDGHAGKVLNTSTEDGHAEKVLNTSTEDGHAGKVLNTSTEDGHAGKALNTSTEDGHAGKALNTSTEDGHAGKALNTSVEGGNIGQVLNASSEGGVPGQILKKTLDYQGQVLHDSSETKSQMRPSGKTSVPAPTSPPAPVATKRAGGISAMSLKDQNETQGNKSGQETTTSTTTTSVKPALIINSTTATNTNFTTITAILEALPPSTTQPTNQPTSTPTPLPPWQSSSATSPKAPAVTSDQDKAIVPGPGGETESHLVNPSSLIAVLIFGLLFFIVTVILFLRHAYESYKRRGYTQMDYLINGMYSDSGL